MEKENGTLDGLNDKLKALTRQKYQMIVEADNLEKEISDVTQKIYETSPDYIRVVCFRCLGQGILETEEKKRIRCDLCKGDKFIYMKKYIEDTPSSA